MADFSNLKIDIKPEQKIADLEKFECQDLDLAAYVSVKAANYCKNKS